jgi:hypothetical protein
MGAAATESRAAVRAQAAAICPCPPRARRGADLLLFGPPDHARRHRENSAAFLLFPQGFGAVRRRAWRLSYAAWSSPDGRPSGAFEPRLGPESLGFSPRPVRGNEGVGSAVARPTREVARRERRRRRRRRRRRPSHHVIVQNGPREAPDAAHRSWPRAQIVRAITSARHVVIRGPVMPNASLDAPKQQRP